ncbi:FtsX-like permease family protein [Granulosicoccus sp. 3-233]|uniref:FtsX-like permease family protein n=1 Tax=Granulosicoccus sp. 3-233 TaxID=3417969 RepID=UPI003D32FA61
MPARLLARSSWHFYRRHPAQLLLSLLGIMLGVAIVTAVLITNDSSQRAFALSSEALYGRTTHQLTGALGMDQAVYVQLRKDWPNLSMAPVIQAHVAMGDEVFSILGLDPFSEAGFQRMSPSVDTTADTTSPAETSESTVRALLQPEALLISDVGAAERGWVPGQRLPLDVGGRQIDATLAGTFNTSNPAAATGLLVGDIGFVQNLLQRGDRIDRVDLILDETQRAALLDALPATLELTPAISRQQTMQAMTRGFHINLTAMSLLALVVGVFLIHNTMTFAVVQRREIFAIKRITGITATTLLLSILAEALVISLIGSVLGILLGYALAHVLIGLTTQTINDLYFVLHVQQISFSPWLIAGGLLLGVGSSVLAASLSALDAAGTSPIQARQRSLIEQRTGRILPRFAVIGSLMMSAGLVLAVLPLQSLILGFLALMLLILGYGLALPWMVRLLAGICRRLWSRLGVSVSLAIGGIERNISRTGLAIAALSIAVSATFGVEIMIGSFRSTVDQWLGSTLQSDIYISAPTAVSGDSAPMLPDDMVARARAIDGIATISTGRTLSVSTDVGTINMLVVEPHDASGAGFELIDNSERRTDSAWRQWAQQDTVMISEPLATRHRLSAGDQLQLFTQRQGMQPFAIAAVFRDFGSSHGKLLMARSVYSRHWQDSRIGTLGIILTDPSADQPMLDTLRTTLSSSEHPLLIRSNTAIHAQSLAVFDRTFEVTRVLRWLTVGVAFIGIFSALLALHLERAREFAIIRASGATRLQIMRVVLLQTVIMGLFAGALALPLGWFMSEILIKVINVRSFGWSMQSLLPAGAIPETLLLACLSALLAGVYPAWRLSRANVAAQLRDD